MFPPQVSDEELEQCPERIRREIIALRRFVASREGTPGED